MSALRLLTYDPELVNLAPVNTRQKWKIFTVVIFIISVLSLACTLALFYISEHRNEGLERQIETLKEQIEERVRQELRSLHNDQISPFLSLLRKDPKYGSMEARDPAQSQNIQDESESEYYDLVRSENPRGGSVSDIRDLIRSRRKRSANCKGKKGKECRVKKIKAVFVHLPGKSQEPYMDQHGTFQWASPDDRQGLEKKITLLPNEGNPSQIVIVQEGVYLVYAQIGVHGQKYPAMPHECAHEVIKKSNKGKQEKVILKSLVTQYNLGQPYDTEEKYRALDTKVNMGVFYLHKGDALRVIFGHECKHVDYVMQYSHSYFGIAKIG